MTRRLALLFVLCPTLASFLGWQAHRMASRPPIRRGVQTWYEWGYGSDASICHNVYPADGDNWFEVHTLNHADQCDACLGRTPTFEPGP